MPGNYLSKVSFYIVAHADDWQLFMHPNVLKDLIAPGHKVVFIITTAGESGADETYWMAREEGSKSSFRYCIAQLNNLVHSEQRKNFNGHIIYSWQAANAVFYFLRLPDGNIDGQGFANQHFQSLSKLKNGDISCIKTVDNSAVYSWEDFVATLESIILAEGNGIKERWVNYISPDTAFNSNDHADHIATGKAVACMQNITHLKQVLYKGYGVSEIADKLSSADFFWKAAIFAVYDKTVFDKSGYSTLKEGADIYIKWCSCNAHYIVIEPEVYKYSNV